MLERVRTNLTGNLAAEDRLARIRATLTKDGRVRIRPLAEALDVSEMTIRRDLQELEALGQVRRVRGGAVAVGPQPFADRHRVGAAAKARIAAKLAPLVPEEGAIGIDASSTLLRLASAIAGAQDLTVLTNGPETFQTLQDKPGVTALLSGGELDPRTGSLVGPLACRAASQLTLRRCFVSAAGLDAESGTTEPCLEEAEVKRALAAVSSELILAVDSSKLGTRAVALAVEWRQIDVLITELEPSDPALDPYRDLTEIR